MKTKVIISTLFIFTLCSCIDKILGHKYVATIDNTRIRIKKSYTKDGLFDHFPKSVSAQSYIYMESCIPSEVYDFTSEFSAYSYLFLNMEKDSLLLFPQTYIYRTHYTDKNFIIDDRFSYYMYFDTLKVRNIIFPEAYPIPYFEDFDFGLGCEKFDLRPSGIQMIIDKYTVPNDLEVYVLKAEHGYFWKKKYDLKRPQKLGIWQNGYSCGIAISKRLNVIVYWMKAW